MRFPAYGNALWQSRLMGARPRVAYLLVGDWWKTPKRYAGALAPLPKLAVKTQRWDLERAELFDWRLVADMTVLAFDVRDAGEFAETDDGWDPWLWLLADVQTYARDVLLFTPLIEFIDQAETFAPERTLETYAWLNREFDRDSGRYAWPRWWPHGEAKFPRDDEARAA
jgi:hypothetical protein